MKVNHLQPQNNNLSMESFISKNIFFGEVKQIKEMYDSFDVNGTGSITWHDIKQALQNIYSRQQLQELSAKYGHVTIYPNSMVFQERTQISFAQFFDMMTFTLSKSTSRQEIDKIFFNFDVLRAGKITFMELKRISSLLKIGLEQEQLEEMFMKVDLDEDGFLTGEDFYNVMTGKVYWH